MNKSSLFDQISEEKVKCKWIFTLFAVLCFVAAFSGKSMAADSNVPYVEVWKSNTYESADLYFRYDNLLGTDRSARVSGSLKNTYMLDDLDAEGYPNWIHDALVSKIQTVHFTDFTYKPTSCKGWFKGMTTLRWVMDFQFLNTEDVTDMSEMFSGCSQIDFEVSGFRHWDLSKLKTQNVTDMHDMFKNCSGTDFTSLSGGTNWNTSNVTDMSGMFYGCSSLTSIDFDKFTTNKVTDMHDMFNGCNNIGNFVFPATFKTDNVTDMSGMFANCTNVTNIDISNFNTSKVENMKKMFYKFKGVSTISISNNTSKVKSMESMFEGSGFTSISFNGSFSTESVENMKNMFAWCKFESIDVSSFNTGKVKDMSYMFYYCKQLASLDLSSFNTSNVENMDNMFQTCVKLASIDVSSFNTKKVESMKTMFYECYELTSLDLSSFETDNVENMSYLFGECFELETLVFDPKKFKTDNVQDMSYMFHYCTKLKSLDVSKFNTANVTNMACMFDDCKLLEVIDVSGFNTAKVTNMYSMFTDCQAVKKLEFNPTYFNTSNVTNMAGMFHNCAALKYLDLSMFNTEKVTDMMMMFSCMASVEWLDLSNFDTKNVTNMNQMFEMNEKLNTILVSPDDWTLLSTLTANHMFGFINTQELIGNKGTIFKSANSTDQKHAHIDEGTSNPGYFTTGRFKIFYNGIDNDDETLDIYTDAITEIPDGEVTLIEPSKEGFAFDGWTGSSATGLSSKVASVTIPSGSKGNRIYTAHWKINQYTITFDTDGGSKVAAITQDYNSAITAPADPTRKGFTFLGWQPALPTTMPAEDITVKAQWRDDRILITANLNGEVSFPANVENYCSGSEKTVTIDFKITQGESSKFELTFPGDVIPSVSGDITNGQGSIVITIPDNIESGVYTGKLVFESADPDLYREMESPVTITANIPKNAALQIYSDVLLVDNHDNNYSAYQWYKDGNAISGATLQFYSEPSFSGRYAVKITDKDGKEFMSCPIKTGVSVKNTKSSVKVYPNPATSGEQFTLEIEEYDPAKDYTIMIFTANGTLVKKLTGLEKINTTTLPMGIYSGSLISNGEKSGFKVIVK